MTTENEPIKYLTGHAHVRLRPGMYIGGKDKRAMHQLAYEIIENAMNQVVQGHASRIDVILFDKQRISISDDGVGIPTAEYEQTGETILELILGVAGGRHLDPVTNRFRGGMFGVGVATVNALSQSLEVVVKRDGFVWQQRYEQGIKQTNLTQVRPLEPDEKTGTQITFAPDFEVLEPNDFNYEWLTQYIRQIAYLVKGLSVSIEDQRTTPVQSRQFQYPRGITEYVEHLNRDQTVVHSVLTIHQIYPFEVYSKPDVPIDIEVSFQYIEQPDFLTIGFVNGHKTDRGTYWDGFISAMSRHFNPTPKWEDITNGLTVVFNIWHPDPSFEGSMVHKLLNEDVGSAVHTVVSEFMDTLLKTDETTFRRIAERVLQNQTRRLQRDL